jgi:hypothetical protein
MAVPVAITMAELAATSEQAVIESWLTDEADGMDDEELVTSGLVLALRLLRDLARCQPGSF